MNLVSQVLNCQRRSTAALSPIGVKWCQDQGLEKAQDLSPSLEPELYDIFGSDRPSDGLAVFTIHGVSESIIPVGRMLAYFVYYLAKATLCFLAPEKKNHDDTRRCVFDRKIKKRDITLGIYGHVIGNQQRDLVENRSARIKQFAAN